MAREEVVIDGEVVVIDSGEAEPSSTPAPTPTEEPGFFDRAWENVKNIPYGVADTLLLTPANAAYNFPDELGKEVKETNRFGVDTIGNSALNSYLNATVRNVPKPDKGRALEQFAAGAGGGAAGYGLGGPLLSAAAGTIAPWLTDQYDQLMGDAPDTPISSDVKKGFADLSTNSLFSWALGGGAKTGAKQGTNRLARGGAQLEDAAQRMTDAPSLQASALSMAPEDQAIRPPRRNLGDVPGEPVTTITAEPNMSMAPKKATAIDGESPPLTLEGDVLPSTDVIDPTTPSTVNARPTAITDPQGNPVATAVKQLDPEGREGYWLKQATAEVPEFFQYKRDTNKPEFPQLLSNINKKADINNQIVDQVLNELPPEANQPVQKALFGKLLEKVGEDIPYGLEKPYRDVLMQEMEKYASKKLADPEKVQDFKNLFRRQKTSSGGGQRFLSPDEAARLDGYITEIGSTPMTPLEMRGLKTEYDKLGKWQLGESGEHSMRKDAYREIANSLRNSLEDVVAEYAPERLDDYQTGNRKLYLGSKFTKMAQSRSEQQMGAGRSFQEGPLVQSPAFELPLIGPFAKWATGKVAPQMFSPEARLLAADADPYNFGTGGGMTGPMATKVGQGISTAGQAGTAALGALDKTPGLKQALASGSMAVNNTMQQPPSEPGFYDRNIAPAVNKIGGALGSAFGIPEAHGEDFSQSPNQALPRDTSKLTSQSLADFMMKTASLPQAPIAQALVKKLQTAFQAQDMDTVERIHADMTKLFPDLFEQGSGVNGKLFDPMEQGKYMDNLRELERQGAVDTITLAKQRNAFANPQDQRMLPVEALNASRQQPQNRMVGGTRIYPY